MIKLNVKPTTRGQFTVTNNINDREFYFVEKGGEGKSGVFFEVNNDGVSLTRVINTFNKLLKHTEDRVLGKRGFLVHYFEPKHTDRPANKMSTQAEQVGASVDDFDLDDNEITDIADACFSDEIDLAALIVVARAIRARGEEWLEDKIEKHTNDLIDEESARGDWEYEQEKDRRLNAAGE